MMDLPPYQHIQMLKRFRPPISITKPLESPYDSENASPDFKDV